MQELSIIALLFLLVLAVLWFLLPFAVFGVKDYLADLVKEQKKTNELLTQCLNTKALPSKPATDKTSIKANEFN
jgi:hypothetical protein